MKDVQARARWYAEFACGDRMDNRDSIISVVTSPLGFFALALLIIEGFLAIVVVGAGASLSPEAKLYGMFFAAGAFALVVIIVALMVWLIPDRLTYRGADWMETARLERSWADQTKPLTRSQMEKLEPAGGEEAF